MQKFTAQDWVQLLGFLSRYRTKNTLIQRARESGVQHNVKYIGNRHNSLNIQRTYVISSASFSELVIKLNQDLENIVKWLSRNKLQLHTKKSKAMFIGSPYNLKNKVGNEQVMINDKPVTRYSSFPCLGVELDERMSWENHIDTICGKVGSVLESSKE